MFQRITPILAIAALAGCASSAGVTSWGKPGVSIVDYRLDSAQCIIEGSGAGPAQSSETGAEGKTNDTNRTSDTSSSRGGTNGPGGTSGAGAIVYSGSANPEDANQAAIQQRSAEMAAKRERKLVMERCLASRGYRQFRLTPEQAAKLATLPEGSAERRDYLYRLGSDPSVISAQGL